MQDGDSPLMLAVWSGYIEVLVKLVESGANCDLQNYVCMPYTMSITSIIILCL